MIVRLPAFIFKVGLALLSILSISTVSHADIGKYLSKYKDISITEQDQRKLSEYDAMIHYFCGFSFFKPRHKVSPEFIKALIWAESRGNPNAVSTKNARGLGQILPETGRQASQEIFKQKYRYLYVEKSRLNNLKEEDLFDPAINILLTCYLISKYNFRFDGRLDLVISAWNAGENIESLKTGKPAMNSETRNLIGKVNGYYTFLLSNRKRL